MLNCRAGLQLRIQSLGIMLTRTLNGDTMKRKVIILDVIGILLLCITSAYREYSGNTIITAILAVISLIIVIAAMHITIENDI